MTDKAKKILRKLKLTKLFGDPQRRDQILRDFNASTLDPLGPVGSRDEQMRVLGEMNELGEQEELIIRDGAPKVTVYRG
jgi:hypothetical protein